MRSGSTSGAIYLFGTLYWLSTVMARYGDINTAGAIVINAVFVAYLALYPALFALVMRRLAIAFGPSALAAAPFVWTATELGRMYVFTGFPWVLLGYSQASVLPIAQAASVAGVFGVSALVASASAALAGDHRRQSLSTGRARARGHPAHRGLGERACVKRGVDARRAAAARRHRAAECP